MGNAWMRRKMYLNDDFREQNRNLGGLDFGDGA